MATRMQLLAFFFLSLCNAAFVQSTFPTIDQLVYESYSTEVQITDVPQAAAGYATESFTNEQGSVKLFFQGDTSSVYYDNKTFQIIEVKENNCTVWNVDESEYDYTPMYYGWLNQDPLRIGPSAPLWYAQTRYNEIISNGTGMARNIKCELYTLPVKNRYDDLTIEYYFAPKDWTSPYNYKDLRIPIRIRIVGTSARYSVDHKMAVPVEQISDFAYFRPSVEDLDLLPPVGLGCQFKAKAENFPDIPQSFQFSIEVMDALSTNQQTGHDNIEIQYQRAWYDYKALLARWDRYSMKNGRQSSLYDFSTGTMFKIKNDGSCTMLPLKDTEFEVYDYGNTRRMMEPKEALNLDGNFYDMGKREIRGLSCDTYESVEYNTKFKNKPYYKLVVTVYFSDSLTYVGINGNSESRIPIYMQITGYSSPENKTLQLLYNIFEFDNVIAPEMYSSFRLDRCFTRAENKASFLLILNAQSKIGALMEQNAELIERELKNLIALNAKVPKMRIPYLKVDYKPAGVYVRGVLLERPPAKIQFSQFDNGPMTTRDSRLKIAVDAKTIEECSYTCVDEGSFLCKGFYFCNQACYLKSNDVTDQGDGEEIDLGDCFEYLRVEIDSTNFEQSYLSDALGFLETAVLNKSMAVKFPIDEKTKEIVYISEIVIGDGPYTGVDMDGKPYTVSIEDRKLDASLPSVKSVEYAGSLHDCYQRCKDAGSECSSFSFCPKAKDDKKQCRITSILVIQDMVKDSELLSDSDCNIYKLKFLDLFTAYPEKVSLLEAKKFLTKVKSAELCAQNCRLEDSFTCRGFEYCQDTKECSLHEKHILDLKNGGAGKKTTDSKCTHYAARYTRDYLDMGNTLIDDSNSIIQKDVTLDECAKICSVELATDCNSFNYCPGEFGQSSCAVSKKVLTDSKVSTVEDDKCRHYEKRENIHDWDNSKTSALSAAGYTKKGFTGLVVGMLALGLIVGALAFVLYSYVKSRTSNDGSMAVRFMKSDS